MRNPERRITEAAERLLRAARTVSGVSAVARAECLPETSVVLATMADQLERLASHMGLQARERAKETRP